EVISVGACLLDLLVRFLRGLVGLSSCSLSLPLAVVDSRHSSSSVAYASSSDGASDPESDSESDRARVYERVRWALGSIPRVREDRSRDR
ncbi:hypothetical protein EDB19DRAFT_1777025, partial [Suillus lakei]